MKRYPVTVDDIVEAEQLLSSIDWLNIDSEIKSDFFEKIQNTIKYLDKEERELFYVLLRQFNNISTTMFDSRLRKIISNISKSLAPDIYNIFITPIVTEQDAESSKLKSGQYIAFLLKSLIQEDKKLKKLNIEYISTPAGLNNHTQRKNSLIVFCDDFIGTGNQFYESIDFYKKFKVDNDRCALATLAILRIGYEKIKKSGYDVFAELICDKGISANSLIQDKDKARDVMEKIEKDLKVSKKFLFGYKKSEALIAIRQRSPNNTFPIFWWNRSDVDEAIFSR